MEKVVKKPKNQKKPQQIEWAADTYLQVLISDKEYTNII